MTLPEFHASMKAFRRFHGGEEDKVAAPSATDWYALMHDADGGAAVH